MCRCFMVLLLIITTNSYCLGYKINDVTNCVKNKLLPEGEFLREDYVQKIVAGVSPLNAIVENEPQQITVVKDKDGYTFVPGYNFHEGGPAFIWKYSNGVYSNANLGSFDINTLEMNIDNSCHGFSLKFGAFQKYKYLYTENASRYVSNIIISGKYRDKKGRSYVFGKDGIAIFPGIKFSYRVGIDFTEIKHEYYYIQDDNEIYVFNKKGNKIYIYKTKGEMAERVNKAPYLVLIKIEK